jgi:RNAse (barnase) inhibitor barstar
MSEPETGAQGARAGRQQDATAAPVASSPPLPRRFVFVESTADFCDATALIIRMPPGIRSKQKLLAVLADKLRFPGYFGWNWDALDECLRDLAWLPPSRPVVIVHEDLPFGPRSENLATYLDILRDAIAAGDAHGRSLSVVLPGSLRDRVTLAATEPR